jgi:hypothetical protein
MVCKKCGRRFSGRNTCPRCGTAISKNQTPRYKKMIRFRIFCIAIIVCFVALIVGIIRMAVNSRNPLMDADFITVNTNESDSLKVSQCGYVKISDNELNNLSDSQILEFAKKKVEGSNLSWVSIIGESGEGYCFAGSDISVLNYGKLSSNGSIETLEKIYVLKGNSYSEE